MRSASSTVPPDPTEEPRRLWSSSRRAYINGQNVWAVAIIARARSKVPIDLLLARYPVTSSHSQIAPCYNSVQSVVLYVTRLLESLLSILLSVCGLWSFLCSVLLNILLICVQTFLVSSCFRDRVKLPDRILEFATEYFVVFFESSNELHSTYLYLALHLCQSCILWIAINYWLVADVSGLKKKPLMNIFCPVLT